MERMRSNPPLRDELVDLRRPGVVELAFRLLADELARDFAECLDIGAPVVNLEQVLRHGGKHVRDLVGAHGRVRADGGKNGFEFVAIVLVDVAGEFAGAGVFAALVGRDGEDALAIAELGEALDQQIVQLPRSEIGIDASNGAIETHARAPLSLVVERARG